MRQALYASRLLVKRRDCFSRLSLTLVNSCATPEFNCQRHTLAPGEHEETRIRLEKRTRWMTTWTPMSLTRIIRRHHNYNAEAGSSDRMLLIGRLWIESSTNPLHQLEF